MKTFKFFVEGRPKGKGRPRMNRRTGQVYTPASTKQYESEIRHAFLRQGGESFCGLPVSVQVEASYPMPKSWSKKQRDATRGTYCENKPDIDNLLKAILDAGNGGVIWSDDKSIVSVVACKRWADTGGVEITITDMSD